MTDAAAKTRDRRFVLAVVALVIGGLLISAASVAISVTLDRQAREKGDCLLDARNTEFDGLVIEMRATTGLLQWAIEHQTPQPSPAQQQAATRDYLTAIADAEDNYEEAARQFAAC